MKAFIFSLFFMVISADYSHAYLYTTCNDNGCEISYRASCIEWGEMG